MIPDQLKTQEVCNEAVWIKTVTTTSKSDIKMIDKNDFVVTSLWSSCKYV